VGVIWGPGVDCVTGRWLAEPGGWRA